ncbi:MAG: hypothetical protein A2W26_09875 [Acidobacteria bacterium RBG_16_64_8]|nr:MAG: hypothetical protein A2W26_09875 [Acidobacteria bacterium RBG_16_64_8]
MLSVANFGNNTLSGPWRTPLPRAGTVIACAGTVRGGGGIELAWVLYDDGSFYQYKGSEPPLGWTLLGHLFTGGPVQAQGTTWGRIKAERR